MKSVGIFEAKTRLAELCATVASSGEPLTVTRRGKPLVRIEPIVEGVMTIRERRAAYVTRHGRSERPDRVDFTPPVRSRKTTNFELGEEP